MGEVREGATLRQRSHAVTSTWWIWLDMRWGILSVLVLVGYPIIYKRNMSLAVFPDLLYTVTVVDIEWKYALFYKLFFSILIYWT